MKKIPTLILAFFILTTMPVLESATQDYSKNADTDEQMKNNKFIEEEYLEYSCD